MIRYLIYKCILFPLPEDDSLFKSAHLLFVSEYLINITSLSLCLFLLPASIMNPMSHLYYKKSSYSPYRDRIPLQIVRAEVELSPEERSFLLAVEKGDYAGVQHALREAEVYYNIDVNCVDPLGRSALLIAIENENLEVMELLLDHGVNTGDALLYAIRKEVVGAVELLLSHRKPSGEKQVCMYVGDLYAFSVLKRDTLHYVLRPRLVYAF